MTKLQSRMTNEDYCLCLWKTLTKTMLPCDCCCPQITHALQYILLGWICCIFFKWWSWWFLTDRCRHAFPIASPNSLFAPSVCPLKWSHLRHHEWFFLQSVHVIMLLSLKTRKLRIFLIFMIVFKRRLHLSHKLNTTGV